MPPRKRHGRGSWWLVGLGLVVSLMLAGGASFYASSAPDGLERVAIDLGFASDAAESATSGSPLADYGMNGVSDPRMSVGLSGLVGVTVTAVAAFGLFWWLARRRPGADRVPDPS